MTKILCSTGALIGRPNGRDYKILGQVAPKLFCDGFEFMMYSTWYDEIDVMVEYLLSLGISFPMVHCEKGIGETLSVGGEENFQKAYKRFEINCQIAQKLGSKGIVLHLWGGLPSDKHFENNLSAFPILEEIANKYGIQLLIENVVCNCHEPMEHFSELRRMYPTVKFVFDTKMAAFHDQLDLIYTEEYSWLWKEKLILHYHLNDYSGGYMDWANLRTLPIGKGKVDFERFFEYFNNLAPSDTVTVESTAFDQKGIIDIEMLNNQFEYIRKSVNFKDF